MKVFEVKVFEVKVWSNYWTATLFSCDRTESLIALPLYVFSGVCHKKSLRICCDYCLRLRIDHESEVIGSRIPVRDCQKNNIQPYQAYSDSHGEFIFPDDSLQVSGAYSAVWPYSMPTKAKLRFSEYISKPVPRRYSLFQLSYVRSTAIYGSSYAQNSFVLCREKKRIVTWTDSPLRSKNQGRYSFRQSNPVSAQPSKQPRLRFSSSSWGYLADMPRWRDIVLISNDSGIWCLCLALHTVIMMFVNGDNSWQSFKTGRKQVLMYFVQPFCSRNRQECGTLFAYFCWST